MSRNTEAKKNITQLLSDATSALSHSELVTLLEKKCDRVTIYRVLDRLVTEGIIHKIINIDGVVKYAVCHGCTQHHNHHHVHFSCTTCLEVTCLENLIPRIELPVNYTLSDANFMISGICPNCKIKS